MLACNVNPASSATAYGIRQMWPPATQEIALIKPNIWAENIGSGRHFPLAGCFAASTAVLIRCSIVT